MIGILVILIISWLLLFSFERRSLLALGLLPITKTFRYFGIGFLITCLLCICVQLIEGQIRLSNWTVNTELSIAQFAQMVAWDFRSILTEELIFRGALLYILIRKIGLPKALIISAMAFGIYHWFSYEIIGRLVPMAVVFIGTGIMGYAWALAFSKTNSVALPAGLHFGWNFTFNTIFSHGPLHKGIIITTDAGTISDWFSLVSLWIVPIFVLIFVVTIIKDEKTPELAFTHKA